LNRCRSARALVVCSRETIVGVGERLKEERERLGFSQTEPEADQATVDRILGAMWQQSSKGKE